MASFISASTSATPMYLHLMVFVILILGTALFLGGTAAILAYRNRLLAARSGSSSNPVSSRADLEKGNTTTHSGAVCDDDIKPGTGLIRRFLHWRRRVLYESDSVPELALLPSYRPKESIGRKILNFLLRKKRVIPDPPTIVTITRVIEAVEARDRAATAAAAAAVVVAKADEPAPPVQLPASPPLAFQIPAIIVQCWDTPAEHTLANPFLPPSCSTASTSTSSASCASSPSCRTPSSLSMSSSSSGLVLSPAVASPATFFFPSFPSASVSSFDYLHVPPPSWGGPMAEQVLADVSNVSGARFVLGPAPPPRAMLKSKSKGVGIGAGARYVPPPACMAFAASAPVKRVEGERKVKRARNVRSADGVPRAPQEGVVGIVSGGVPLEPLGVPAGGSSMAVSDRSQSRGGGGGDRQGPKGGGRNEETKGTLRAPGKHARPPRPDSEVPAVLDGLPTSSSTTSSLVDLILEAIAAETDESFHYTTVSSSFGSSSSSSSSSSASSSSRSSTSSTASSRSGASWASDEDEEGGVAAKTDRDGDRSFLMLEDESEEDFLDAVLSAYIRTDDENSDSEVYSSNPSSGSDYGEFDDIDLCDSDHTPGKSAANVKGMLPPRRKFLSAVRIVHPGFAI